MVLSSLTRMPLIYRKEVRDKMKDELGRESLSDKVSRLENSMRYHKIMFYLWIALLLFNVYTLSLRWEPVVLGEASASEILWFAVGTLVSAIAILRSFSNASSYGKDKAAVDRIEVKNSYE